MPLAINIETQLTAITCGECGGTYAIASRFHRQKKEQGGYWTCPYCKSGWGFGESEIERLNQKLDLQKKRTEWARREAEQAERRRRAAAGQLTKFKNRVGRGVCPCCNRSFQNLQRHMQRQHPDLVNQPGE